MEASNNQANNANQQNRVFTIHEDPGHSWMQVPYSLLKTLGIEKEISEYSYRKGNQAYLEEDLDRTTFLKAYFAYLKKPFIIVEIQEFWSSSVKTKYTQRCPVRNFESYYVS